MGASDFNRAFAPAPAEREYRFTGRDFERVQRLIHRRAGINLNDSKQNMVYSRLTRRLRVLGLDSFDQYLLRLETDAAFMAAEAQEFVNALTTNLTAFFREPHHFPMLAEFLQAQAAQPGLRLWCAAASTGEEPYSMAMTMIEALGAGTPARLLATDIDTRVLAVAQQGIYRLDGLGGCGEQRLRRFFLRGTGANEGKARVKPQLQRLVEFAPLNLLEPVWHAQERFAPQLDGVFIRNVMIYFDRPTQRRLLQRLAGVIRPGGLLFIGHSETFTEHREQFALRGKTVYERL